MKTVGLYCIGIFLGLVILSGLANLISLISKSTIESNVKQECLK